MKVKVYDFLSADAKLIREEVFVEEQKFQYEFDDTDDIATHMVMYNDAGEPVATCRVFQGSEDGHYIFGRLAVMAPYRGMNLGAKMIQEAEDYIAQKGGTWISLHAQCRVTSFYEKSGFTGFGEIDDEEGIPHIWMRKKIRRKS